MIISDPHGGGKDAVVGDVVSEHAGVFLREGMVGLDLDGAQALPYRQTAFSKGLALGDAVDVAHESAGVVG